MVDLLLVMHTVHYQFEYNGCLIRILPRSVTRPLIEAGADVRVGMLTTDMGSAGYVPPGTVGCGPPCDRSDGTSSSDEGLLIAWPPCWPDAPPGWPAEGCGPFPLEPPPEGYPRFMDAADPSFEEWLQCFAQRQDGCSVNQPLESLYRALEPGRNPGFLREGSILAVITVTSWDDCSIADPRVLSTDTAVLPYGYESMCAYRAEYLHPLERYVDRLLEVRPPERLAIAVYAGSDREYSWCPGEPDCSDCSTEHPCLLPDDCFTGVTSESYPSPRLHGFARLLGATSWGSPVGVSAESCPAIAEMSDEALDGFLETILDRMRE